MLCDINTSLLYVDQFIFMSFEDLVQYVYVYVFQIKKLILSLIAIIFEFLGVP